MLENERVAAALARYAVRLIVGVVIALAVTALTLGIGPAIAFAVGFAAVAIWIVKIDAIDGPLV